MHFRVFDLLKAVACNLIVLHHLAFYGPMADVARPLAPEMFEWLEAHARIAVHAFLVMGGFLAARSLSAQSTAARTPVRAVLRRFVKLAPPFMAAMLLAVAASALAAQWMTHDSISSMPNLAQVLAHASLLHGVLGYESLSAGAWYVAIDFQLFALMTLLLYLTARPGLPAWLAPSAVAGCTAASLLYFNLDSTWDNWAPYFFGSYGLGALAWWASERTRSPLQLALLTSAILLLGGLALDLEFRSRIALALGTALLLVAACKGMVRIPGQDSRLVALIGRISYSVFLIHFPVSLVVNAAFTRFAPALPEVQAAGVVTAWLASIAAGAAFHRWVELPLAAITETARGTTARNTTAAG
ncbi:acyltransferase [Noviherbaspirillum sp.]|uniref:acyltransferase family protein n=1 Tax=Noviherbaspirillum sp. TaxID=1926288 RepID=UPI002D3D43D8|nr:acyltransferase [Noviherbaspirillum sp.]HZW20706.1 acyltransferase [Noviherbaspirillum sp.]